MLDITESDILDRLKFDNPWWEGGATDSFPIFRSYFDPFRDLVLDKTGRALVLMGPRRVGKTVMIKQMITVLLGQGIDRARILFASIDTPIYSGIPLERLVTLFLRFNSIGHDERAYVFFDEIQYLSQWELHLKSLVDSFPHLKFVVSGSAAAALRMKSLESGAGRFTDFQLPPLTFAEYLNFIDCFDEFQVPDDRMTTSTVGKLNIELLNYLNYGGYPEAVLNSEIRENSDRYIRSDIIEKVLPRDLPGLYGIRDVQELNHLFTVLAYNTGNELTLESLSKSSTVAKNTLKRYIEYLEAAFLIRVVDKIDQSAKRFRRATAFKVYLTNPSMRSALFGLVSENHAHFGNLIETAVLSQWLHGRSSSNLYYARWKGGEVDVVWLSSTTQKPIMAVEVKWSDRMFKESAQVKNISKFVARNGSRHQPVVTSRSRFGEVEYGGQKVRVIPASVAILRLGRNLLHSEVNPDWLIEPTHV